MLNIFNIEKQTSKRVQRFLLHKSTEENIEYTNARLVINIITENITVHLYEVHRFVKTLPVKDIVEFFGKEYDKIEVNALYEHLKKMAEENNIPCSKANVVICEIKGEITAHLYEENKYVKRLLTNGILKFVY